MKNVSCVTNGIIATAIVILSTLFFASCKDAGNSGASGNSNATSNEGGQFSATTLPIAYVNMDSVLSNYQFSKDVNEKLQKKAEDIRLTINQKGKKLEKDMAEFQNKMQNNAFLSEQRAQQEYDGIQKQQEDLQKTSERLQTEWAMDQQKENLKLADSIRHAVKLHNETGKYEIIFNMNELDNIILANPKYDITDDVLTLLNGRYKPEEKK